MSPHCIYSDYGYRQIQVQVYTHYTSCMKPQPSSDLQVQSGLPPASSDALSSVFPPELMGGGTSTQSDGKTRRFTKSASRAISHGELIKCHAQKMRSGKEYDLVAEFIF